jgi:MFS family permease
MLRREQRPAVTDTDTGKRTWQILAVVRTGSFMAVLETTIVNVALPSIQQGAHASSGALEWVVSGYALTFGLALVPAGRLGDRYGYKRLFLIGLSLFTLASVACGVSQNAGELIIARLVQGLGAGVNNLPDWQPTTSTNASSRQYAPPPPSKTCSPASPATSSSPETSTPTPPPPASGSGPDGSH